MTSDKPEPVRVELEWESIVGIQRITGREMTRDESEQHLKAIKRQLRQFDRGLLRRSYTVKRTQQLRQIPMPLYGLGGGLSASYDVINFVTYLTGAGAGVAFLKAIRDVIIAWMKSNAQRQITVTVGKAKIEIKGVNDIDAAIAALAKIPNELAKNEAKPKHSRQPGRAKPVG
jgi:hypothetical protein